jgi:hypothetical protein
MHNFLPSTLEQHRRSLRELDAQRLIRAEASRLEQAAAEVTRREQARAAAQARDLEASHARHLIKLSNTLQRWHLWCVLSRAHNVWATAVLTKRKERQEWTQQLAAGQVIYRLLAKLVRWRRVRGCAGVCGAPAL